MLYPLSYEGYDGHEGARAVGFVAGVSLTGHGNIHALPRAGVVGMGRVSS